MEQYKILQPKEGVTIATILLPGDGDYTVNDCTLSYWSGKTVLQIELPPGFWQLLGIATEIPESIWQGVVEPRWDYYKNYLAPEDGNVGSYKRLVCDTATKSAMSLLEKHEVYSEQPDCPNQWCDGGKIDIGYNEYLSCELCEKAEATTGTWVILKQI